MWSCRRDLSPALTDDGPLFKVIVQFSMCMLLMWPINIVSGTVSDRRNERFMTDLARSRSFEDRSTLSQCVRNDRSCESIASKYIDHLTGISPYVVSLFRFQRHTTPTTMAVTKLLARKVAVRATINCSKMNCRSNARTLTKQDTVFKYRHGCCDRY